MLLFNFARICKEFFKSVVAASNEYFKWRTSKMGLNCYEKRNCKFVFLASLSENLKDIPKVSNENYDFLGKAKTADWIINTWCCIIY